MSKEEMLNRINKDWLVLILRGDTPQQTEDTFDALIEGGATLVEVPFTTPGACGVISNLRKKYGDKIIVSAGTVTTVEQALAAIDSGAQGIVSPNLYPAVVEVAVDAKGQVRVVAVDMAMDCGPQINPERIRAQMEGGAIMGLGLAMVSEISFEKGRVKQSNFHDYEVLRHNASPRVIRTHLVNDDHALPPGGVGEPPVPPVAPALCNAIFAATGKRVRSLPVRKVA